MNLLITCSKNKTPIVGECRADALYGASHMFRHLQELASIHRLTLYIRSAQYGFIRPDTLIEAYDLRLAIGEKLPPNYPAGNGWWFGPEDYFDDAPDSYTRLLPKMTYGLAESAINWLKVSLDNRNLYFAGNPPPSGREIILAFFQHPRTIQEGNLRLQELFSSTRDYSKAILSVLGDRHKHRGYSKSVDNGYYLLTMENRN